MRKKDTVIIAALVNGALLSLLMLFATQLDETAVDTPTPIVKPLPAPEAKKIVPKESSSVAKVTSPLDAGDQILVKAEEPPAKPAEVVKETPSRPPAAEPQEEWYVVKNGDSPWKIAKAHNITTNQILSLNDMSEEKARSLKPGAKIRIR